ncbi:MAG: TlyA family RNA methyltransferase [Candidatus Obscuribacterales bacterium]|nr:TlyA family RNA methyltransferase [Candidatus Obscuribacterales bacterium]
MSTKGKRLDLLLEEQGYFQSRQHAKTAIMDGNILVNGEKITKPGTPIKDGAKIEIVGKQALKYVSRGGYKLEKALQDFNINPEARFCLDVGASTGGFTDCLLKAGAGYVYAVDVGYGQIAWSLRSDPRVRVIERCNARNMSPEILQSEPSQESTPDLAVIDVSFISLLKVLAAVKSCLAADAEIIALVKPQFEAGPDKVGKKGVVRSAEVHSEVIEKIVNESQKLGLYSNKLTFSPLKGPEGNIEFLLLLKTKVCETLDKAKIDEEVQAAQACLIQKTEKIS